MLYLSTTRKWLINGSAGAGGMSWLAKAATRRSRPPNINMFGFVAIDVESWFQKVKMETK